jgi:hypothetical protein
MGCKNSSVINMQISQEHTDNDSKPVSLGSINMSKEEFKVIVRTMY